MAKLEELVAGVTASGILPSGPVAVITAAWVTADILDLTVKDAAGNFHKPLLFRESEHQVEVLTHGAPWSFDGDPPLFRLVAEAKRISLAHLFDPMLAIHTSQVDPLPHQIVAVYETMLPRQPLRFLLADDPGAGKTIMAGLLIKELQARGDVKRCLVVCPGSLVDQWQDELKQKFDIPFTILSRAAFEDSLSGNPFQEHDLVIARLDHLSRNDGVRAKLEETEWDLVICDEAHKMAAHFDPSGEVERTKRYQLGESLGRLTRHLLLLTATPHNGKDEDFQLFLRLLDMDRFEGKPRRGQTTDATDLIRRLVKEDLLTFEGTKLFPERIASTLTYQLSDDEAKLYAAVTTYVREQWALADQNAAGDGKRRSIVGFALTTLQRRLASSPEAIYQSLRRRRERLESRLRDEQLVDRGNQLTVLANALDDGDFDDEAPAEEIEEAEETVVDQVSAARTVAELKVEIQVLRGLEERAQVVRASGIDKKWQQLSDLLNGEADLFAKDGKRHKLIVFTEHRDTLNYLRGKVATLLGRDDAVVTIDGSMSREERKRVQSAFQNFAEVQVLIATDAAGEGVNLQQAHLMVNYDLPWNPNRLEQRFGRIHRIGQTEVCHLWNLVAAETREGDVYTRLLQKIEVEGKALGGQVFDVLGQVFRETPLRELMIEAIRYGDRADVRARLFTTVDNAMDQRRLRGLIDQHAIVAETFDRARVERIRDTMERAEAARLQPHFVEGFFKEAFTRLGGEIRPREARRFEITAVPLAVRQRAGRYVEKRYVRVTFERARVAVHDKPVAEFLFPGHPLVDAVISLTLERHALLLKQGAVLVAESDTRTDPRVLIALEHKVRDGIQLPSGEYRVLSHKLHFVEIDSHGEAADAGPAPYLDYRPPTPEELAAVADLATGAWISAIPGNPSSDINAFAVQFAATKLVQKHLEEVKSRRIEILNRTETAVRERLVTEIGFQEQRAAELRLKEEAGKPNFRLNSAKAQERARELTDRLDTRLEQIKRERFIIAGTPEPIGGAVVIPGGLLAARMGPAVGPSLVRDQAAIARIDRLAVAAVLAAERGLGHAPVEKEHGNPGYDIESRGPGGHLRFIEVKGKAPGSDTVTISKTQVLAGLNMPDAFILALVTVAPDDKTDVKYIRRPFTREPDYAAASINYELPTLLATATAPS